MNDLVAIFSQRLDDLRSKRIDILSSTGPDRSTALASLSDKLGEAISDAADTLDPRDIPKPPEKGQRAVLSEYLNEGAVWGPPEILVKVLKEIADKDLTYIALACAIGAAERSRANVAALVEARLLPEPLVEKVYSRTCCMKQRDPGIEAILAARAELRACGCPTSTPIGKVAP